MKPGKRILLGVTATFVVTTATFLLWQPQSSAKPRREALGTLVQLERALSSMDREMVLELVQLPTALQGRSRSEQADFLRKVLSQEISPEGLTVLSREGRFGTLSEIFPDEADTWAAQGGAAVTNCVAFRLERNGARAEVVLARDPGPPNAAATFRILRCNDVRRMAEPN